MCVQHSFILSFALEACTAYPSLIVRSYGQRDDLCGADVGSGKSGRLLTVLMTGSSESWCSSKQAMHRQGG